MKRLFIGIPAGRDLVWAADAFAAAHADLPVRWISGRNLHFTLVPPWYTENVNKVISELGRIPALPQAFEIKLDKVSLGPEPRAPRLIWAEGRAPQEAVRLKAMLEKALRQRPENRPFDLHLTLARFHPEDFARFRAKRLEERVEWGMIAESFALYETHLSAAGAEYELLKEFRL